MNERERPLGVHGMRPDHFICREIAGKVREGREGHVILLAPRLLACLYVVELQDVCEGSLKTSAESDRITMLWSADEPGADFRLTIVHSMAAFERQQRKIL